ncbi:hypothetical protein B0A49_07504, partial [Cryomyces minteri]
MEIEERPAKKRRFFVEDSSIVDRPFTPEAALPDELAPLPEPDSSTKPIDDRDEGTPHQSAARNESSGDIQPGFDAHLFQSFVGEDVPAVTLQSLQELCGDDVQRAINMYLDGSWRKSSASAPIPTASSSSRSPGNAREVNGVSRFTGRKDVGSPPTSRPPPLSEQRTKSKASMPEKRYIGALGVVGWATRSGTGLIKHDEKIGIERT